MDVRCAKCNEPWDWYGAKEGDMTGDEFKKFSAGKGCPSCCFGSLCTQCKGSGRVQTGCATCHGDGVVFPRREVTLAEDTVTPYVIGYENNLEHPLRKLPVASLTILYVEEQRVRGDSPYWYQCVRAVCPDCVGQGTACDVCHGDGKFHQEAEPGDPLRQLVDMFEADDGDPIELLERFDL